MMLKTPRKTRKKSNAGAAGAVVTEARDDAMGLVAASPLPAVLAAGVIGFAVALLIGRR